MGVMFLTFLKNYMLSVQSPHMEHEQEMQQVSCAFGFDNLASISSVSMESSRFQVPKNRLSLISGTELFIVRSFTVSEGKRIRKPKIISSIIYPGLMKTS